MRQRVLVFASSLVALLTLSCSVLIGLQETHASKGGVILFTDVTKQSGLDFQQNYGDRRLDNIVEGTGTGVCVFDYNNDGFLDVYFPNGKWTHGISDDESRDLRGKLSNHLFRNNGDGTFTDVTEQAGLSGSRYSAGCAAGGYDNDGNVDLLLLNYGQNELFHNNGNGRFTEVSTTAGLTSSHFSLSAVWFDYNHDGYLDLFVGNYVKYDQSRDVPSDLVTGYPGPLNYDGQPNLLYRNNGDGTFPT